MSEESRRADEEALMAAQLAGSIAGSLRQVAQSRVGGTDISKTPIIDPRAFLTKEQQQAAQRGQQQQRNPQQRQQAPVNMDDPTSDSSLAPRVNLIKLPEGVNMRDVLEPFIPAQAGVLSTPAALPTESAVIPVRDSGQLEMNFSQQVTNNDIYNRLDSIDSKLSIIIKLLNKKEEVNAATTVTDKKKSV